VSRPHGYYESIEVEAKEMADGGNAIEIAKMLIYTRRQLEEQRVINLAGLGIMLTVQQPEAQPADG
jgi:hypothetical protein